MLRCATVGLSTLLVTASAALGQLPPGLGEAIGNAELLKLQGSWRITEVETGAKVETVFEKGRTLFIGGPLFLVKRDDEVLQAATVQISPNKKPRAVDATVRKGPQQGSTLLGIYEVKGDTLRVCFDSAADQRPKGFKAGANSSFFMAVCKRVTKPDEEMDITGVYQSEFGGGKGPKTVMKATIGRWGDAYLMQWLKDGHVAWYGIGMRKGNALSVSYINAGNIGISVYEIKPGPKLAGMYSALVEAGLIGKEELVFVEKEDSGKD
jgi:uncharacterized protein (TIGR03067 family)